MEPTSSAPIKKKILIVEDELFIRELYVKVLEEDGYEIDQAEDGEIAFEKIHAGGYDLVLLDIMLPKMDGLTILEKLQNNPPIKQNNAIVLLTNLDQELTIAKGVSLGIRGYIIKSQNTPKQLKEEVIQYLSPPNV